MNLSILDCTLRDGGYYTNWDFKDQLVDDYIQCMKAQSAISHIEIGYRSNPQKNYLGKYYYCPKFVLEYFRKQLPNKKLCIMLNEKDTETEDLERLLSPCIGNIDLVRMAVAPDNFQRALKLSKKVQDYGFEVGMNLMYMSKWGNDKSFLNQLSETSGIIDYLYLVDSYGGITGKEIEETVKKVSDITSSSLGFHGHNNMELAFANTIIAIDSGCKIVDSTILGMGRGAGNLKTELILTYISSKFDTDVSFNELGSLVNNVYEISDFSKLLKEHNWGTNLAYMVSGANSLPQKDVMDWISSRAYSINSIIQALKNEVNNSKEVIDIPKFENLKQSKKKALIIGGGQSTVDHAIAVNKLVDGDKDYCIIHASAKNAKYYNSINVSHYYCLIGNEGYRLEKIFKELEFLNGNCVLAPAPRKMGTYIPNELSNKVYELEKINFTDKYMDSHFAIALQIALNIQADEIYLIGFDGYPESSDVGQKEIKLSKENEYLISKFNLGAASLKSITPTNYKGIKETSIYQILD
tara:strand:- start:2644 stop:4215 length:1572 start_codon:yes stop_codon:yes gene_type:complete